MPGPSLGVRRAISAALALAGVIAALAWLDRAPEQKGAVEAPARHLQRVAREAASSTSSRLVVAVGRTTRLELTPLPR